MNKPDVVVIGGGPAGSTVSTLIAQHGHTVAALRTRALSPVSHRRVADPRDLLGPEAAQHAAEDAEEPLRQEVQRPVRQRRRQAVGAVLLLGQQAARVLADVAGRPERVRPDDARQRARARRRGPRRRPGGGRAIRGRAGACGVTIQTEGGARARRARQVVVDASGQNGLLQNRFKLRVWDPVLNKGAIWTYWKGAYRDTGRDEGATMVIQTANKKGWFWYIPLHDDIVSVGVVGPFDYLFKGRGEPRADLPGRGRALSRGARSGSRTRRASPGYFATKDYSYRSKQVAGDGWVLVGDAFGFLDPLYSSGVLLALKSGRAGRRRHRRRADKGDLSAAQLGKWGPLFNQGMDRMRRLVCEYYDGFSFGKFVRHFPDLREHGHRPADRRSLHRPRRQGLGADGIALRAGQERDPAVERRHAAGTPTKRRTSCSCPRGNAPETRESGHWVIWSLGHRLFDWPNQMTR